MTHSPPRFQVLPSSRYSAEVGSFVAMLEHCRASVLDDVQGLSEAQLSYQHDENANPIGALLAHMAAIEWFYAAVSIEAQQPQPHEWAEWGSFLRLSPGTWAAIQGQSLEQHLDRLARVRARTLAGLLAKDDAWLSRTFTLPWTSEPANNRWALYHLLEDELNHRGQIRWLKTRLPTR